jgi:hypothetical protein
VPVCQFVPGSGEEQPTSTVCDDCHLPRSRSECPINAKGSGRSADALLRVRRRKGQLFQSALSRLIPSASSEASGSPAPLHD